MNVENSLRALSFDPIAESRRLLRNDPIKAAYELARNLEAYEIEVIKDLPVSLKYSYWFDGHGNLYTNEERLPEDLALSQFDPRERGGFFIEGFQKMTQLLRQHPGEVILWYSPPGQAAFEDNPENPYAEIKFTYGQLYIQYFDGGNVNSVAIKVTNEGVLDEFIPHINAFANQNDPVDRIKYLLTHPTRTGLFIDDFFNQPWTNQPVYQSHKGNLYDLDSVLSNMKGRFFDDEETARDIKDNAMRFMELKIDAPAISAAYAKRIYKVLRQTGEERIPLAGSCGGSTVTRSEIESILGISNPFANLYTTKYRLETSTKERWDYYNGDCVLCNKKNTKVGPCNICTNCEKEFN